MKLLTALRPADLRRCHVQLAAEPAAAARARRTVRDALRAWDLPVDDDLAVLLTSELVTNAIRHAPGQTITLDISCSREQLLVGVHDTSQAAPVRRDVPPDAETGRGLMLIATLATGWGVSPDPAGKAVYFTLAFQPDPGPGGVPRPREEQAWGL